MAVELGTAFLSIMPSMRGFSKKLASDMREEGAAARKSFDKGFDAAPAPEVEPKVDPKGGEGAGKRWGGGFADAIKTAAAPIAAYFAVDAIKNFASESITAASDMNETVSKSSAIFGAQTKSIDKWANNAATQFGLAKSEALDYAAGFGDMARQLGMTGQDAASFSKDIVQVSADLGSFNNLETDDVLERISAAMRGEYDSLQAIIPNISAARVESEALALTGKKTAKEITAADKALAVQAILHKDGARAMGDFNKTSGGFANQQKIMAASMQTVKERLGTALLPLLTRVMGFITGTAIPAIGDFAAGFTEKLGPVLETVSEKFQFAVDAVQLFIGAFTGEGADVNDLGDWMNPIIDAGAKAREVFDAVTPKVQGFLSAMGQIGPWAKENADWILPLAAGITAAVAAYQAYVTVQGAIRAATSAWTAIQWALNAALNSNPIGIVIAVIAGLVAAIVVLYNKNEAFRNLVNTVWAAIQTAIGAVVAWFQKWVVPVVTRVFQDIGKVATWLWKNVISPVAKFIANAFRVVGLALQLVWKNFLSPIFQVIGAVFKALFTAYIRVYSAAIQVAFKAVGTLFRWVWENLLRPVFNLLRSVFGAVASFLGDKFAAIRKGFGILGDKIRAVWDKYVRPVFDKIGEVVGKLHEKFSRGVDAIGRAWEVLKDKAKEPVRFVIETVINGLIGKFNDIAKFFGTDTIPEVKLPPGFHDGGWTGPGGKFKPAGIVHADEFVVSKSARAAFEKKFPGYLDHINRTGSMPGYADGGLVTWKGKTFSSLFARNLQLAEQMSGSSFNIFQGGYRPTTSYSGTSHAKDAIDLGPITTAVIVALRKVGIAAWDRTGKGNWAPHIHAVPTPGAGFAGGSAVWQAQDYLNGGDGLGGRDNGPRVAGNGGFQLPAGLDPSFLLDPGKAAKDFFAGAMGKLDEITNSPFGRLVSSVPGKVLDAAIAKIKDLISPVGYAGGTSSATRGLHWVGENGAELVDFRGGESVYTARESAALAGGVRDVYVQNPWGPEYMRAKVAEVADERIATTTRRAVNAR